MTLTHSADLELDLPRIRSHFDFVRAGRTVTNNAASTQPPRGLLDLYRRLAPWYENVHRGQSSASRRTTELFESSYDTIAAWLNAPSRRCVATFRNTTEALNAVMYSLMTEFRDGDNVVTTMLEHNSNFVPWYALTHEILPRFGRRVECRTARFDPVTGRLDLDHLASLVDHRTKLITCTGASNFMGTKTDLAAVRRIARTSGSLFAVDGAQLLPTSAVDVQALDVDYLCFSFHKMLAPFGVGVLYAKEQLLTDSLPFLYGGDMIAEGQVAPDRVLYNRLPWKYTAGTPNILGVIVSAQALRFLLDLTGPSRYFETETPLPRHAIEQAMARIAHHTRTLTARALDALAEIEGLRVYGPPAAHDRTPLVAFNVAGVSPFTLAEGLNHHGVESRAGCHCATLAHRALALDPLASCRLSFYLYNTADDVDRATSALTRVLSRG
ncbi:aminotransferase class V-fold PLP-dependent enzyme [Paractinoplanes atraurantiacus]|uniref:Cysteine desulfurase / selenocysteine lyase n=1 Tax=Paractinoplanes atraurantiacus TaxID=1036182 RepID=A0A285JY15_9ACTN|nr:aminotransferase class V-fold PLP-dependent enzyme [Actinoplanes atraurantiacus]SNY65224.1 cysteine desulfurase / selenocysteine lyase [Actinoplanes atraurantiacus]